MTIADLSRFRVDESPKQKPGVAAPDADFHGYVLTFDQSVRSTGWALVHVKDGFEVVQTGMINTTDRVSGKGDFLLRGQEIYTEAGKLVAHTPHIDLMVVEEPPVALKNLADSGSSSLAAAVALACVATEYHLPFRWVHAQRAHKHISGNYRAKKAEVKEALLKRFPEMASLKPFNEHVVDAICCAVTAVEMPAEAWLDGVSDGR